MMGEGTNGALLVECKTELTVTLELIIVLAIPLVVHQCHGSA